MFSLASDFEQLSLMERVNSVRQLTNGKPQELLRLLNTHVDLPTLIPHSFRKAYYASTTNDRDYSLESILAILLLLHFFKIQSQSCFLTMMHLSPPLQEFCRLPEGRIPDDSVLSKFKIAFEDELRLFFESLALKVMGIFDEYDASLPEDSPEKGLNGILISDPTGLKPKVKENNPKTLESEIKRQSSYKKYLENQGKKVTHFDLYLAAWKNMPKYALSNEAIRLGYANGHFGYFYKFGLFTNGFGIPLYIHFFDNDFYASLPGDFDTPEDQKYAYDNASLAPMFKQFYGSVGYGRFHTFLGDSEFDSYDNYGLLNELGFSKMLIPLNSRASPPSNEPIPRDHDGIPCCPKGNGRFLCDGSCKGKNRSLRFKFVCPLSRKEGNRWVSDCADKCRPTNSTVTTYTYTSEDLRTFPGILRGSKEWADAYKRRTVVEREISSLKSHPALARPNTYNCASMRADVYLNASAKLLTVILAFALGKPSYMRNLKNLLLAA